MTNFTKASNVGFGTSGWISQISQFSHFVEIFTADGVETRYKSVNTPEKLWQLSKMIE